MAHECNAYCRDGGHALCVLTEPGRDPQAIIENLRAFNAAQGYRIVDIKPAREADISVWQQRADWRHEIYPDQTAPWLLFVVPLDHGDSVCP